VSPNLKHKKPGTEAGLRGERIGASVRWGLEGYRHNHPAIEVLSRKIVTGILQRYSVCIAKRRTGRADGGV